MQVRDGTIAGTLAPRVHDDGSARVDAATRFAILHGDCVHERVRGDRSSATQSGAWAPPKAASRPGRRRSGTRNPAERCLGHTVEIQMETILIVLLLVLLLGGGGWYGRGRWYGRRGL